ncbi:MAG: hypothetical protein IJR96_00365 [Pseudobutyrivibrio sp.]|nr:hypothetical protein [Pseudobutyrivibrio sp.]
MNKKKLVLIAASLLVLGSVAVKPTMAYFTDTHTGKGEVKVTMGEYEITPDEDVKGMIKKITVKNTGDFPVYARVKVLAGSTHGQEFLASSSENWESKEDGFYYYKKVINPGEESTKLAVEIVAMEAVDETFNVIVVEEATRVQEDGSVNWEEQVKEVFTDED